MLFEIAQWVWAIVWLVGLVSFASKVSQWWVTSDRAYTARSSAVQDTRQVERSWLLGDVIPNSNIQYLLPYNRKYWQELRILNLAVRYMYICE